MNARQPSERQELLAISKDVRVHHSILTGQVRKGLYGEAVKQDEDKTGTVSQQSAQTITKFHAEHVSQAQAMKEVQKTIEQKTGKRCPLTTANEWYYRATKAIGELPDEHPILKRIMGRTELVGAGRWKYLPREHLARLLALVVEYETIGSAERKLKTMGLPGRLLGQLKRGEWNAEFYVPSRLKRNESRGIVHQSIIDEARELVANSLTPKRARRLASVDRKTVDDWVDKHKIPEKRLANRRYINRTAFLKLCESQLGRPVVEFEARLPTA